MPIDSNPPTLADPGAGLPLPELVIARALFAIRQRILSHQKLTETFHQERHSIQHLIRKCSPERLTERVLIKRIRGLEDSSRYWSVYMTLDHLRIVHDAFSRVICDLGQGKIPEGTVSTAAVKPNPEVTGSVLLAFEESCENLLSTMEQIPAKPQAVKYAHPWFGPLSIKGWHALAGTHLRIHRHQIELILQTLDLKS